MRFLLVFIFFFLIQKAGFAQQKIDFKKVAQSRSITFDKYESFLTKPITTKDGIFYIKGKGRNYMIVKLSDDLKVFRQKKLKLRTKKRKHRFEFLINNNDKLLLFSSYVNKSINKRSLVYFEVNTSTLEVSSHSKPMANLQLRFLNDDPGTFDYEISPDQSKIVFYSYKWKNDKRKILISLNVFDSNLNKIWSKEDFLIKLEYGFTMRIGNLVLDNMANIHWLKRVSKKQGITFNKEKAKYDYSIFSFFENGEMQSSEINPKGNNIIDLGLKVTRNQDLIAMGFYNNENLEGVNGIAHIPFDKDGAPIDDQIIFSTVSSYEEDDKNSIWGKVLPFYNIKNIYEKPSGNLVLVGEDSHLESFGSSNYYYHGEMIVVENKADGNPFWMFEIHKDGSEESTTIKNQSYLFFPKGDDLFFIFNNHPDNLNGGMKAPKVKSQITITQIDTNGKATIRALFPRKKPIRQRFTVNPSARISEDEILIFKYDRLLKLKME